MDTTFKFCLSLSILFCVIGFINSRSLEIYGKDVPVQKPYIPLTDEQIVKNYKNFASKLVKDGDLTHTIDGVIFGQFSLGYALAILNEQVILNVSTSGFSSVLETPDLQIRNSYRDLLHILRQDRKVSIQGIIYTQQDHVLLTVGLGKLRTNVSLVDPKKSPDEYIDYINNDVNNKSEFGIPVSAFPNGKGIRDGDYFATILNYKNSWDTKWQNVEGNQSFNSLFTAEKTKFMETTGHFDYISNEEFEGVKIPLQGGHMKLLLANSKKHVDLWDASGKNVWEPFVSSLFKLKANDWSSKALKVQVPIFQYLSGTSYFGQLKKLGITQAMCLPGAGAGTNSLDQIGQISKVNIGAEEFTLTVITETKDNISGKNKRKSRKVRHAEPDDDSQPELSERANPTRNKRSVDDGKAEMIVFNQPYFWSLEDEEIGSIAMGAILLPVERTAKLSSNYMEQYLQCDKAGQD